MFKRISALCVLLPLAALAQGPSRPATGTDDPDNPWYDGSGISYHSNDTVVYHSCRTITTYADTSPFVRQSPVVGLNITLVDYTTQGSGWHSHEVIGDGRPQAILGSPRTQPTDATGCVQWTITFPGYAGWYTFEGHSPSFTWTDGLTYPAGVEGVNTYAGEWWVSKITGAKEEFVDYPDNTSINQPQTLFLDPGHAYGGFSVTPEATRFLGSDIVASVQSGSNAYIQLLSQYGLAPDKVEVARASLADGGNEDNVSLASMPQYSAPNWAPPTNEQHALGVEIDVPMPTALANRYILLEAFQAQSPCEVGAFQPGTVIQFGVLSGRKGDAYGYWLNSPYVHFVCAPAPFHTVIN